MVEGGLIHPSMAKTSFPAPTGFPLKNKIKLMITSSSATSTPVGTVKNLFLTRFSVCHIHMWN